MKSVDFRIAMLGAGLSLAACQPPASENYSERAPDIPHREAPSVPIDSPDTTTAIWSPGKTANRLLYGSPGRPPLLVLVCLGERGRSNVTITRFVEADPEAGAIMALIGNGHRARLPIASVWNGRGWLWEARYPAELPDLDVFTGQRAIDLTLPGAGKLVLNPSPLPGRLVERCRGEPDRSGSPA
ncbi:hypothetical protein [Parerythrobacter lacustris]|uniref:Lipoprotein n=1 Tax=Parerythrobacter lacustris TaxID=2969984 RepID=A0ABT1XNH2_9SPHN|nr:hypothetical protein [Parerythrobacter lacustris]MCR2833203.1 hypothetical protein [Parerythrobacter lacustris]